MKILLVHNFYGSSAPSGENMVFQAEKKLLEENGHIVIEFTRHSDEIRNRGLWGALKGGLSVAWNPFSLRNIEAVIKRESPDIMHVHNFFPLISPSIFHAIKDFDTAAVFTLHNYRIFCAAAIPMRKNAICTECLDSRSVMSALKYGCYRNGKAATMPLAAMIALHRTLGTWAKHVDAFIALTAFQRQTLANAGLPGERIYVKPHFYPEAPNPAPWTERENKAVFIGRIGEEKGVDVLLDAWKLLGPAAPKLEIIGDGPSKDCLSGLITGTFLEDKITFTGQLPFIETQRRLGAAKALVLPSRCFEGFPMVIREAFALGVPVIASRIGSIPDIVRDTVNGTLSEPGNAESLGQIIGKVFNDPDALQAMSAAARLEFEDRYTAETNLETLIGIYEKAIRNKYSSKRNRGDSSR